MAKPRFFVARPVKFSVDITGPDAHHIKDVLRLGSGDVIEVVDPQGNLSDVEITEVSTEAVSARVIKSYESREPLPELYLFQALPKGGKMDDIVRQATEVGVAGIFPVISRRVVAKVEADRAAKKSERWQKIAAEASKQSHRTSIPRVSAPLAWRDALRELANFDQVIVFWEEERDAQPYEVLDPGAKTIAVVIGPEGGLSEQEVEDLVALGARVVTLGESILRVETAAPVAAALVLYDVRRMKKQGQGSGDATQG